MLAIKIMKNPSAFILSICAIAILSACSNPSETPEGAAKDFFSAVKSADIEKFTSHLDGKLKELAVAKKADFEKNLQESKLKIVKCGGIKNLTSTYSVAEEATATEGYTLIEYKDKCPSEKQYLALVKNDKSWLITEIGPSVKVP
jgi:hypothetical protein